MQFKDTFKFKDHIVELIQDRKFKEAGLLFEIFATEWHLEYSDYAKVYDANKIDSIPPEILDKLDAWELLEAGGSGDTYGIDKIAITRKGEIDIHQDKSTFHLERNLSANKAEGMMSLRNNPLKNVRNFVINTLAKDLSHYKKVWKDQPPLVYGLDMFLPNSNDSEEIRRDRLFWKNIQLKLSGRKPKKRIFSFVPRNIHQSRYVENTRDWIKYSILNLGYSKSYNEAVGGVGKSVLDPVTLAEVEYLFDPTYTNTPCPVSVSFYHSSKTLPKNGWEEVQRRRAVGIYDEVIVVSGTNVVDGEDDSNLNTVFPKTTSYVDAIDKILTALENNKSVLILTLYHHADQIEQIKNYLNKKHYPGFKFWYRKRDEADWPCANKDNRYAPALDDRTDSVITFGSTGTLRLGGDPITDYGMNNKNIHGSCSYRFSWTEAERAGLVKPLILLTPTIFESEFARMFPEFVDKNGRVDWRIKIKGEMVDQDYPTAKLFADLIGLARTLIEWPEIKRILFFSHTIKHNKLAQVNWPLICGKIFGNSNLEKSIKKLFWTVLNDHYDCGPVKDFNLAIKRAKANERYMIGVCQLASRGYDDAPPAMFDGIWLRHHAAIHLENKSEVVTMQELWRVIRLDDNDPNPFAYYILPLIYNDIDDEPTFSQERIERLLYILRNNDNVKEQFESYCQTPGRRKRVSGSGPDQFWIPEDLDPSVINSLVNVTARTSRGTILENVYVKAHNWLTDQYLQLSHDQIIDLGRHGRTVEEKFYQKSEFQPLFDQYTGAKRKTRDWKNKFLHGGYVLHKRGNFSTETRDIFVNNILAFKEHKRKAAENRDRAVREQEALARAQYEKMIYPNKKWIDLDSIQQKTGLKWLKQTGKIYQKFLNDPDFYKPAQHRVYEILIELADNCQGGTTEWSLKTVERLQEEGYIIGGEGTNFIKRYFIRKDGFNVLAHSEWESFKDTYKDVVSRASSVSASKRILSAESQERQTKNRLASIYKNSDRLWKVTVNAKPHYFNSKIDAARFCKVDPSTVGHWAKKDPRKHGWVNKQTKKAV